MSILITNKVSSGAVAAPFTNGYSNSLINGAMDFFQRGSSGSAASGVSIYTADRWYTTNSVGAASTVTYLNGNSGINGSKFLLEVVVAGSPTTPSGVGTQILQVLENQDSIPYYGSIASFSAQVKANGNVTQIGVQFMYATTETKLTTTIGTEQLYTINTSTYSLASIVNQAMGTAQTTVGVVGIRIRATAVSTGDLSDSGNGFFITQAIMTNTSTVQPFRRAGATISEELMLCQRFCFQVISTTNSSARFGTGVVVSSGTVRTQYILPVVMRVAPTLSFSNAASFMIEAGNITGTATTIQDNTTTSNYVLSINTTSSTTLTVGFGVELTANGTTSAFILADADI